MGAIGTLIPTSAHTSICDRGTAPPRRLHRHKRRSNYIYHEAGNLTSQIKNSKPILARLESNNPHHLMGNSSSLSRLVFSGISSQSTSLTYRSTLYVPKYHLMSFSPSRPRRIDVQSHPRCPGMKWASLCRRPFRLI